MTIAAALKVLLHKGIGLNGKSQNQAGWHISQKGKIPEGIHLLPLPSHSPQLQPAERLWSMLDEPIANRTIATLDELEGVVVQRCQILIQQKALIRVLTNFHWWTQI